MVENLGTLRISRRLNIPEDCIQNIYSNISLKMNETKMKETSEMEEASTGVKMEGTARIYPSLSQLKTSEMDIEKMNKEKTQG